MHMRKAFHEENRLAWNEATVAHNSHKGDQAAFFRNGGTTLNPEEVHLLGNIRGLSLVHLQCNAGQDTLSLARLGASVTGVDISDIAIDFARQLSHDAGIPATFQRMDIYDWLEQTARGTQRFEIVFCSYGALVWLSDISAWARGISAVLKPGGRFVVVDFHAVTHMFDWSLELKYPYFMEGKAQTFDEGIGDYVAISGNTGGMDYVEGVKDFKNPFRGHQYTWGIGEIVTALLEAGLSLDHLKEYSYVNGFKPFEGMLTAGRRCYFPADQPSIPLMFSIVAHK
jgi:2-polyprenyl-3-methyl-5-hydroxy-6-metoxy-1,4-benzoquinol methylase